MNKAHEFAAVEIHVLQDVGLGCLGVILKFKHGQDAKGQEIHS
jgi:hypothetical protein